MRSSSRWAVSALVVAVLAVMALASPHAQTPSAAPDLVRTGPKLHVVDAGNGGAAGALINRLLDQFSKTSTTTGPGADAAVKQQGF